MISPVDKPYPEELDDEEAYKARPQWFKFFYAAWLLSTTSMDDDQQGWYMRLLTWAASEGEPAGFLPDDDEELKVIAGVKDLNPGIAYILKRGVEVPEEVMEGLAQVREIKWQKVRRKFRSSSSNPGYIYNKRLLAAIKESYKNTEFQREHGRKGGLSTQERAREEREARKKLENYGKDNLQEQRGLKAGSQEDAKEGGKQGTKASKALSLSLQNKLTKDSTNTLELKTGKRGLSLEQGIEVRGLDDQVESNQERQDELVLTPPEQTKKGKHRRVPETVFDEGKFIITALMKQHLFEKYPELDDGDLEWMRYKFCNVYHNTKYASWSRTFYNFVFNQITKYDYEPGSYKRRKDNGGLNAGKKQKPWESASERNSRLEQEAANYTRKLRGGSVGDTTIDSQGLTLGPVRDD